MAAVKADPVRTAMEAVRTAAARAFAGHVLTVEMDQGLHRSYWCRRPGTGIYSFRVVTWPGWLTVSGDVGFLALSRCPDMIDFVRGAIDSPGYLAEKAPGDLEVRRYDPDCGEWWLRESIREADDTKARRRLAAALRDEIYVDRHTFCAELLERGIVRDCDFPACENYTGSYLWCREALRWLADRLPAGCRVAHNN